MQKNKFHSCLQRVPLLLVMAFVSVSCTEHDLAPRESPAFALLVRAYDADRHPLNSDVVKDVTLYVFDKNKAFLESRDIRLNEIVTLDYPNHESLTLVAWGNGKQGSQMMPKLKEGDHLETAFVSLIHTRQSLAVAGSPDDLLHGIIYMKANNGSTEELAMRRKTAGVAITARYLKEYAGSSEGEFSYVLRKSTDKLDFYGKPNGSDVCYSPEAEFNAEDEFVSPVFHILPTEEDLRIDIYQGSVLKTTILSDNGGRALRAEVGKLLNVLVSFTDEVSVELTTSEWGKRENRKEF